jgi:ATP-dependent DNA ligase
MRHEAILSLYKNVVMVDDTAGAFDVDGNQVQVDENLVAQEIARLQAEYDAKQYQRKRAAEYPSTADQFDLLYHGGYDAWKAAIDAVKTKYPKA